MRLVVLICNAVAVLLLGTSSASGDCFARTSSRHLVSLLKFRLNEKFLVESSIGESGHREFRATKSRVVSFQQAGNRVEMLEEIQSGSFVSEVKLADLPLIRETQDSLVVDFAAGFNKIYSEEARTGRDYAGTSFSLSSQSNPVWNSRITESSCKSDTLVLTQVAKVRSELDYTVHYFITPYKPNRKFVPFVSENLDHFGFYENHPLPLEEGGTVLYAMKFDSSKPITFAISDNTPQEFMQTIREGAEYWNRAFGRSLIRIIDAPAGVRIPDLNYNIIQWSDKGGNPTSHIQGDPRTGEILHANIFLSSAPMELTPNEWTEIKVTNEEDLTEVRKSILRLTVAHEMGHALGFRHNFKGKEVECHSLQERRKLLTNFLSTKQISNEYVGASTVMDYLGPTDSILLGAKLLNSPEALDYDRQVIRHVYFLDPINFSTLPPFITDSQVED